MRAGEVGTNEVRVCNDRTGKVHTYKEAYAKYAYTPNFRPYLGLTPRSRHAAPGDRQRLPLPVER